MSLPYTIGWIVVIGVTLVLEALALLRKEKGDTLSEHTWWVLRRHTIVWFVALGLAAWTLIHFFARTWVLP